MVKLHVIGFPGDVGGASTELWHTLLLWRSYGAEVTLTPTWRRDEKWADRCESIGCEVLPSSVRRFECLPGSVAVSFCNSQFWGVIRRLRDAGVPTVWVPCMNYLGDRERRRYQSGALPSAIVCQSDYQRAQIKHDLLAYGMPCRRIYRIRGAFDASAIPFQPATDRPDRPEFTIGRISRADPKKFRADLWGVLGRVREQIGRPMKARVLGWKNGLRKVCGDPPEWAEVHEPGSLDSLEFLRSLDVLYQSGETAENWPRVGLEAMAAGVPIVVDNRGGWPEMTEDGRLAALVSNESEAVDALVRLSQRPQWLPWLLSGARQAVETKLGSNAELWGKWQQLFTEVDARGEA